MRDPRIKLLAGVISLGFSVMACRPVLTVGWGEVLLVSGVILLVFTPLVIRVLRNFRKVGRDQDQEES
jgi:hypothetical protein